jgi:hypothetical protein
MRHTVMGWGLGLLACTLLWSLSEPKSTWTIERAFDTAHDCRQWVKAQEGKILRYIDAEGMVCYTHGPRLACYPHTIDPRAK